MQDNKSRSYIVGFTILLLIAILIFLINKANSIDNQTTTPNPVATQAQSVNNVPDATRGSSDTTINADITLRDIDFTLNKEQILDKESKMEDTLGDPTIAESADGYTYVTYLSNPETPLSYNNIPVSAAGNACLTYVFNNGTLEEVRLQFGTLTPDAKKALLDNISSQYGENTFYRSTNGTETYWWKSDSRWLMLTYDSVGTTLFLRRV